MQMLCTMKNSSDRHKHFGTFRSPTPDEPGWESFLEYSRKLLDNDPKERNKIDRQCKKAISIAHTQAENGVDLIQDKEIRYFHAEFNDRAWKYGFGSMPSNFNVMEGFFQWRPDIFYFEISEEVEHMFSMFDFFDFVTSKDCSNDLDYFIENVEEDLIYTYNILNQPKDIKFSTSDSKEYVLGGVSFIRRHNEVFMMLIAGEITDTKKATKELPDLDQGQTHKSYIKPSDYFDKEAVKLFDDEEFWKVNIYARIDLEKRTIDSRYIQKDAGNVFQTITDDVGMLRQSLSKSISDKEQLDEFIKKQLEEVNSYAAIYEAAFSCLYLPEYFDFYDSEVVPEDHPTKLYDRTLKRKISSKEPNFNSNYFFKTREIWVLDRKIKLGSETSLLRKSELKIEKSGYWKPLSPGAIGTDKNGQEIHSRTWVQETLAWYESIEEDKEVKITLPNVDSQNQGYVYLMRNAAHDLDIVKIGLTTKTPEERAKQLSKTASPDNFLIIDKWLVEDCVLVEKLIHEHLKDYRINPKREFFKISVSHAIKEIIPIVEKYKLKGT